MTNEVKTLLTSIENTQTHLTEIELEVEQIQQPDVKTYTYEYVKANGKKRVIKRTYQPKPKVDKVKSESVPKVNKKKQAVLKCIEDHKDELMKLTNCKRAAFITDQVFIDSKVSITDETVRKILSEVGMYEFRKTSKAEK